MKCEGCGAYLTEDDPMVIVSHGPKMDKVKFYNRVCVYALKKEKSCLNNCRVSDPNLTWEAELKKLEELELETQRRIKYIAQES